MLNGVAAGSNVNGITPTSTAAKSVNGTPSMLGLQKATAAAVAQQKQLQQQQKQHSLVNGGTKQIGQPSAQQGYVGMTTTPLKGGRNSLLRNESPSSIGEKSPPRMTPHASPIPTTLPANVHQVSRTPIFPQHFFFKSLSFNYFSFRKMLAVLYTFIQLPIIRPARIATQSVCPAALWTQRLHIMAGSRLWALACRP